MAKKIFCVFADGAGRYADCIGGWCAFITDIRERRNYTTAGCATGTDVLNAEFMAIISGIKAILNDNNWNSKVSRELLAQDKPSIYIYSDRRDLVGQINNEYKRGRIFPELWLVFEYYEKLFEFKATHVKRETNKLQNEADKVASELRIVLMDYFLNKNLTNLK